MSNYDVNFDQFWAPFWSLLGRLLGAKLAPNSNQKYIKNRPVPPDRPKTAQEHPKSAPRAPQDGQERPRTAKSENVDFLIVFPLFWGPRGL